MRPATGCPVCASRDTADAFVSDGLAYRHCADCGLRFSAGNTNANFQTQIDKYPSAYVQYLSPDAADDRNHEALLASIRQFGGALRDGSVLDVGCGSGKLVRFLRARDVEAYGVEPATALFDRFLAGDPWFFRSVDAAADAIGRSCPVVIAVDVLEHVADPVAFLRALRAVAAPRGLVVISTPDAGSLVARALGPRWHHCNRFHLSLLCEPTLARAAADANLRVGAVRRPGRVRSLGYVSRYLVEFGLGRRSPGWLAPLDRCFVKINVRDTMLVSLEPERVADREDPLADPGGVVVA